MFEEKLAADRPAHFPLEFYLPKNGKKFLNSRTTRAMQTKISLKFPFVTEDAKVKQKMKPTIKQTIIDDFDKAYALNCDQTRQR